MIYYVPKTIYFFALLAYIWKGILLTMAHTKIAITHEVRPILLGMHLIDHCSTLFHSVPTTAEGSNTQKSCLLSPGILRFGSYVYLVIMDLETDHKSGFCCFLQSVVCLQTFVISLCLASFYGFPHFFYFLFYFTSNLLYVNCTFL